MAENILGVVSGKKKKPFNVILFATPGLGKSTWAANAPKPIFLGADETEELDVDRFPIPATFDDFLKQLGSLILNPKGYKTVVVDTIDSIEKLVHAKVLASDPKKTGSMMAAHGGYAKAYEKAETELFTVRNMLKQLRDTHGMNIIILGHSKKVKATDTVLGLEYDTFEMSLYRTAQAIFVDWVSAVLFGSYVSTKKDNDNSDKVFAMGHGQRIVYTEKRPGHLAKNRFGLPYEMDLDFDQFYGFYNDFYDGVIPAPETLIASITGLMTNVSDEKLIAAVAKSVEAAKTDSVMLGRILARVKERVGVAQP